MIRSVYEGIVFSHKQHLDKLEKSLGKRPQVIRISGGGTNSKQWCQIFSDILNIPVETLQGSELGGLGGAIASQQAITGDSLEETVRKMVRIKDRYEPDQEEHKKYIKKYEVYQEILKSMDTTFRSLKKLNEEL